jgi:hypothetical protein
MMLMRSMAHIMGRRGAKVNAMRGSAFSAFTPRVRVKIVDAKSSKGSVRPLVRLRRGSWIEWETCVAAAPLPPG